MLEEKPRTFGQLLKQAASRHGTSLAVVARDGELSYGDLDRKADRLAAALHRRGIGRGDRLAIASANCAAYPIVFFATARLGACLVNLLNRAGAEEAAAMLERTSPSMLFLDRTAAAHFAITAARRMLPIAKLDPGAHDAGPFLSLEDLLQEHAAAPFDLASEDDPLAITFTGGTTGRPKGCMVSHRNRLIAIESALVGHRMSQQDIIAVSTPLAHAIASLVWYPSAVRLALPAILLDRWSVEGLHSSVMRQGVNAALLVPTQLAQLIEDADRSHRDWSGLRKIVLGGAPAREDVIDRARLSLPWITLIDDFGQSETGPLSYRHIGAEDDSKGSVGRPASHVNLEIVDSNGVPVPAGSIGEIVTAGPHLMLGYFDDPTETAAYFKSGDARGWTGDLGRIDARGNLVLAGRSKDMIVSGGENVYAREVELILNAHPSIGDSAVLGIPDAVWGEIVVAVIELVPGAPFEPSAVIGHCRRQLADYKQPRRIIPVESLPRNPAGKILKKQLLALFDNATPPD